MVNRRPASKGGIDECEFSAKLKDSMHLLRKSNIEFLTMSTPSSGKSLTTRM